MPVPPLTPVYRKRKPCRAVANSAPASRSRSRCCGRQTALGSSSEDEAEHAYDGGERERAGHDVVGPGLHDRSRTYLKTTQKDYEADGKAATEPRNNRIKNAVAVEHGARRVGGPSTNVMLVRASHEAAAAALIVTSILVN